MTHHPGSDLDQIQQALHRKLGICVWCGSDVLAQERVDDPTDVCYTCYVRGLMANMERTDAKRKT
jgi:hypothetical protein